MRARQESGGLGGEKGLESLLTAIVRDDRRVAKRLLHGHPGLSTAKVTKARLYESEIVHWLYAGDTALHLAAAGHRVEIVRMLLLAGAEANACGNHRRSGPLHYACDGFQTVPFVPARQMKVIELLLKAGADLDAADKNGATALHRAVRTRSAAAVAYLLKVGADAGARNRRGATAFHLAVQNTGRGGTGDANVKAAQREVIMAMLAHGASPAMEAREGKTVLNWARSAWIRELLAAGR